MQQVTGSQRFVLGLQHTLAMFGATVLVPLLTGLNPSIALLTAGLGTLLFHLVTKGKVSVFLGSSFAFIGVIQIVAKNEGMAKESWLLAAITLAAVLGTAVYGRGFFRLLPIMTGVIVGFAAAAGRPAPVDSGAGHGRHSIVLFGVITLIGVRTVVDAKVDFANSRNLVIAALILVMGLGGASVPINATLKLEGMALAALIGIVLNKLLPEKLSREAEASLAAGD
ncbi:MAG TPA: solute carrier family 23 protein [Symbiobacteriaceae bacterium]|jgi:uracil permease|nr:solute carrier family 23 protein [Symbiobacteriaceae bacterium]